MAKKASKPKAKPKPARVLAGFIHVMEVDRVPNAIRHTLGTATDADGVECRVSAAFPAGQAIYIERDNKPTRYVLLADLIGAMLEARPKG